MKEVDAILFVGIDLAWTYKNETGLCILNEEKTIIEISAEVYSDEAIVEKLLIYKDEPMIIAIDAPLVVNNISGSRAAERLFMKEKINGLHHSVFNCSRNYLEKTYGSIRGEILVKKLIDALPNIKISTEPNEHSSCIIEVFPSGSISGVFPEISPIKYKYKPKHGYDHAVTEINRLMNAFYESERNGELSGFINRFKRIDVTMKKKAFKILEDQIDALICAFSMLLVFHKKATIKCFGTVEDGFISIPIRMKLHKSDQIISRQSRTFQDLHSSEIQFDIRLLTVDDIEPFRHLRLDGLLQNPEAFGSTYEIESKYPISKFEQRLAEDKDKKVVGAFCKDQLIGSMTLIRESGLKDSHKANLYGVYLAEAYRGQGVAKKLLMTCHEIARTEWQIEQVRLSVVSSNLQAIKLYEGLGYTTYGVEKHALKYLGEYFDEILMVKFFGKGNV